MGIPVLVMGESGSGKSASMRNLDPSKVGLFNVAGKPLPFRNQFKSIPGSNYEKIRRVLERGTMRSYVIDDSQYLLAFELFDRAYERGYDKFTDMANKFVSLVRYISDRLPEDTIVYFLHHSEATDRGTVKAKTVGKMIDNNITLEGLFSIVLYCTSTSDGYRFITQSNGVSTAKSPMGMFQLEMDNDLNIVDETIREYYFGPMQEDSEDEEH